MGWLLLIALAALGLGKRHDATSAASAAASAADGVRRAPGTATTPQEGILRQAPTAPAEAARALAAYLRQTPAAAGRKDLNVATFQARMGGLSVDGRIGPKTRARAQALGVTLP